jgi:hypothetical protein
MGLTALRLQVPFILCALRPTFKWRPILADHGELIPIQCRCRNAEQLLRWLTDAILMTPLTIFGLFAVTAMLVCYALESRSRWFILAFAGACMLGSAYGFLQGAWPFGLVEAVWSVVAIRRWAQTPTPK